MQTSLMRFFKIEILRNIFIQFNNIMSQKSAELRVILDAEVWSPD